VDITCSGNLSKAFGKLIQPHFKTQPTQAKRDALKPMVAHRACHHESGRSNKAVFTKHSGVKVEL
jgi:hypothetical protein